MVTQQAAVLSPEAMVEEFQKNGVTHVVTIPDSETNYLYELMKDQPWLDVVPASREGETFAIALGLLVAGQTPVVLIQNTGMMESG
ncbi:MAG: thiamine pyrophosphate-binding protein, partial [Chloroflexi bacterium]|nr:thiamine pyrophosphate-binding protein [Chloroflexota bacterium]